MGDLESCKLSEVPWAGSGQEKYHFDNPQVCMIFNSGELTLVEYGRNEILGSCRTEHMSPHLISVRLSDSKEPSIADVKKVAYLLDLQTIRITDLITGITEATVTHEAKVDWMEMNGRATKVPLAAPRTFDCGVFSGRLSPLEPSSPRSCSSVTSGARCTCTISPARHARLSSRSPRTCNGCPIRTSSSRKIAATFASGTTSKRQRK